MHAERTRLDEQSLRLVVHGLVGSAAATEFFAYRALARQLPHVEAMLRGEAPIQIPEQPDQKYALCTAAVHHVSRDPGLLSGLLRLTLELSSDFAAMCLLDYLNSGGEQGVSQRAQEVFGHPAFGQWRDRHGPAFRARFASVSADPSAAPSW